MDLQCEMEAGTVKKNHQLVAGRLLQMDKQFSSLKQKQKEQIAQWFYEEYRRYALDKGLPLQRQWNMEIVDAVYRRIEAADIWVPFGEVKRYYIRKKPALHKRFLRELSASIGEREK